MVMSGDGAAIFVNRPVTLSLILLSLFLIAVLVRKEVFSNKWRKI
jgi:hypothetical protein